MIWKAPCGIFEKSSHIRKEKGVLIVFYFWAAGRSWFWHRRAGLGKAARVLVVAGPRRLLVDDEAEPSCRRDPVGHVVWRRKILRGECLELELILLSVFFITTILDRKCVKKPSISRLL